MALRVRRDPATGHLWYPAEGVRLHIRFREEAVREKWRRLLFDEVYFKHYRPSGADTVVDFGAGLGFEIARLARLEPRLRYVAVEIQPWVYECLCLTLAQLPDGFTAFPLAVAEGEEVRIAPTRTGEDASILEAGPVRVPAVDWEAFVRRHGLGRIALLKLNVEGAEADLLRQVDLDRVDRVAVAVHDFRADRGESERFRTGAAVEARLRKEGFRLTSLPFGWIYADRP